jgi:two-component sensor histidine kinase
MGTGSISVEGSKVGLPIEKIAPIGLLVNELVTNAFKNGAARVRVSFGSEASDADRCCLELADDGDGFPADFDPQKTSGLGMKVVRMVVRQLEGTLRFGRSNDLGGAEVTVHFPLDAATAKRETTSVS